MYKIFIIIIALGLSGCVSLSSVALTQIPEDRTNKVTATNSDIVVFWFVFDNDFVNVVPEELRKQCPNGKVQGILTKYEYTDYFLSFVVKRQVKAEGYCIQQAQITSK